MATHTCNLRTEIRNPLELDGQLTQPKNDDVGEALPLPHPPELDGQLT